MSCASARFGTIRAVLSLTIMDKLAARGAQAVILGCTEITLLVQPAHTAIPLYDTTAIHARAAVEWALR